MTVAVTLHNGKTIYPSYDPEHRKGIIEFYSNQFDNGLIQAWRIV